MKLLNDYLNHLANISNLELDRDHLIWGAGGFFNQSERAKIINEIEFILNKMSNSEINKFVDSTDTLVLKSDNSGRLLLENIYEKLKCYIPVSLRRNCGDVVDGAL